MTAALLAAVVVTVAELTGRRGVDLAASVHRVDRFRHLGFTLWDPSWYGGHWTLGYSILYPPLAATLGVGVLAVGSAALSALAFDRLVRPALGAGGWPASILFAAGTLVAASIGQLPFLTGEAFGLAAVWALARRRPVPGAVLALLCTVTSPLSGAFVALAAVAWALARGTGWRDRAAPAAIVAAVSLVPTGVTAVLFPGQGPMPYPFTDYAWEVVVAAAVALLAWRAVPAVRVGALLFLAAATFAEVVPSALGGNVGRLEDVVALPLAVGLVWGRWWLLLPVAAVPLTLSQWAPAWGALTTIPAAPAASRAYFTPLDRVLAERAARGPAGRVEVVPTAYHWESAYVAPTMPLARGWERQLDEADNPLFYGGRLDPATYRAWLLDNGVRFVALPSAPLDMAGQTEGALVESGRVPGLHLVWRSADWRLYSVAASPGITSGPARLVGASGGRMVLQARAPGRVVLRVSYTPDWTISAGAACVGPGPDRWLAVQVRRPGPVVLTLSVLGRAGPACPVN